MGDYTRFEFDATLKQDVPTSMLDFIKYRLTRTENHAEYNRDIPFDNHPFFSDERWSWILTWHTCNGHESEAFFEERAEGLFIHLDTNLKNYDSTIELFLMWVAPMVNLNYPCTKMQYVEGYEYMYPNREKHQDCSELIHTIQKEIKLVSLTKVDFKSFTNTG